MPENNLPVTASPAAGYWMMLNAAVFDDPVLTDGAKLLYTLITSLTRRDGYCYATNAYLAERIGKDTKSVQRLIKTLKQAGHLTVEVELDAETRQVKSRKIWCLTGPNNAADPHLKNEDTPHLKEGTPHLKNAVTSPQKCGVELDNKNIYIPPKAPHEKKKRGELAPADVMERADAYARYDDGLYAALLGFMESRAKLRKPIKTDRAMVLLLNKLDKLSRGSLNIKIAMLDEATMKGWSPVYLHDDWGAVTGPGA